MGSRYFRGLFLVTFQMSRFRSPRSALSNDFVVIANVAMDHGRVISKNFRSNEVL